MAARGFPREGVLLSSSVASTYGDSGATCSLTCSSFSFCHGGRPWVLRQHGVGTCTQSSAGKDSPLRRTGNRLLYAGSTGQRERYRWEITACPVLGRLHWDVLLGGCRAVSCLQGHNLGLRCWDGMWRGRRWSCLPFSAATCSCVQLQPHLDRLSAMCKDFTGEKRASLAAVPNPISANINHSSHIPQDHHSGQWQSAEKQRVP